MHARSPEVAAGPRIEVGGVELDTLAVPPEALAAAFGLSFEEAAERLAQLPRMYVEPDGSFVWVSSKDELRWQVDGQLFDRNGRLLMVDLKGSCTEAWFKELLGAFGWPATDVMFELTREAVFVGEREFRRYAAQ